MGGTGTCFAGHLSNIEQNICPFSKFMLMTV